MAIGPEPGTGSGLTPCGHATGRQAMATETQQFTEKAQQALLAAQHRASRLQHPEVNSLHLLMALTEQEQGVVPRLLETLG